MATSFKTPGVYVEEIAKLPPSVAQVSTAVPALIGFTQNDSYNGLSLINKPKRIKSLKEYEEIFGFPDPAEITITINADNTLNGDVTVSALQYRMYYALQLYFANGGGPCYINCLARYGQNGVAADGLAAIRKEDEPTMILFPDALLAADESAFYGMYAAALQQAADLMDRVVLIDLYTADGASSFASLATAFRNGIGNNHLSYGAAYYPYLRTQLTQYIDETSQSVSGGSLPAGTVMRKPDTEADLSLSLFHFNSKLYFEIKRSIEKNKIVLPPSAAVAGIYCQVDRNRGVWKAPANVSLSGVREPMVKLDDEDQQDMNITDSGKSVNAIRSFSGKGILVWGARTLAGNDNEWRYISVRRFYNMVEESVKKASEPFVFEPNDANTWNKVKGMIENFLILQWRAGALQGAKPEHAFYVRVGLGTTMTALDVLEGRMIVEIGMAVVRPAEFIILRFSHKMVEA